MTKGFLYISSDRGPTKENVEASYRHGWLSAKWLEVISTCRIVHTIYALAAPSQLQESFPDINTYRYVLTPCYQSNGTFTLYFYEFVIESLIGITNIDFSVHMHVMYVHAFFVTFDIQSSTIVCPIYYI